jgi:hypothetical protein
LQVTFGIKRWPMPNGRRPKTSPSLLTNGKLAPELLDSTAMPNKALQLTAR